MTGFLLSSQLCGDRHHVADDEDAGRALGNLCRGQLGERAGPRPLPRSRRVRHDRRRRREGDGPSDGYDPFIDIGHGPSSKAAAGIIADILNSDWEPDVVEICRKHLHSLGYYVS